MQCFGSKAGTWFGGLGSNEGHTLLGIVDAPGFEFQYFTPGKTAELSLAYPQTEFPDAAEVIAELASDGEPSTLRPIFWLAFWYRAVSLLSRAVCGMLCVPAFPSTFCIHSAACCVSFSWRIQL